MAGSRRVEPSPERPERRKAVESSSVRSRLAEAAGEDYALIRETLRAGIDAKRKVKVTCPNCKRWVEAEAPDWNAIEKCVRLWLNQGFGAPAAEAPVQGDLVVTRVVVAPDGEAAALAGVEG